MKKSFGISLAAVLLCPMLALSAEFEIEQNFETIRLTPQEYWAHYPESDIGALQAMAEAMYSVEIRSIWDGPCDLTVEITATRRKVHVYDRLASSRFMRLPYGLIAQERRDLHESVVERVNSTAAMAWWLSCRSGILEENNLVESLGGNRN